jgi:phage tail tube protein FII
MASINTLEAANLFCGTDNPTMEASQHLSLTELKLPQWEENYADHLAGGAPVAIRIDTHINPLECTFNLLGFNPQVMGLMKSWIKSQNHFTAYGLIRDRLDGKVRKAEAEMWGRLSRVNPTAYRRNDVLHHEYQINGITHYRLVVGDEQIFLWDFFLNTLVIGGVDKTKEWNDTLHITGGDTESRRGAEVGGQFFPVSSTVNPPAPLVPGA